MQKFSRNSFTCPFTTLGFLPRMKRSVIGLFGRVMNNNVELCSDWLFHSAAQCWALLSLAVSQCAHFSSSQEGNTGKIYISILSRAVISLGNYTVNKMWAQGAAINMLGTETAFECTIAFTFTFKICDRTNSVYTMEAVLTTHLQDQMLVSGAQDL